MWKFTIPDEVLEKLRCLFCNEYLSHLPVYSYPEQGGDACALCPYLADQKPIHNISYAAVAKYLLFPCRFKNYGCIEKVFPSKMLEHESSCKYKQYFCPSIPLGSCTWQGTANDLYLHYEEIHRALVLQETNCQFNVDLVKTYEAHYLLIYNGDLFMVQVKCEDEEDKFWGYVHLIENVKADKRYCYQIVLKEPDGLNQIKLEAGLVDCSSSMHINKMTAVCIATNKIKSKLQGSSSIICCIEILPYEDQLNDTPVSTKMDKNEFMLQELECPVCREYMVPPIYQCVSGHCICDVCKSQLEVCPICRSELQNTRNYTVEKFTLIIKYSCKNRDFGCNFVSNSIDIRDHENTCKERFYNCPFESCYTSNWTGKLTNLMEHVKCEHNQNINTDTFTFSYSDNESDDSSEKCFICKAEENLFRIILKYQDGGFFWSIQCIGPSQECDNFQCELEIINNTGDTERLLIRKKCAPLTEYDSAFNDEKFYLKLPIEMLRSFINNQELIYKCHIIKIQNHLLDIDISTS